MVIVNNLQVCDGTSSDCPPLHIKDTLMDVRHEAAESSSMTLGCSKNSVLIVFIEV